MEIKLTAPFAPNRFISGTFIQLDHWSDAEGYRFQTALRAMTAENWGQMLRDMQAIGIDTLIFQQAIDYRLGWDQPRTYYRSKVWPSPEWLKEDLYSAIVEYADQHQLKIYHSLGGMGGKDPYLFSNQLLERTKIIVNEITELYGDTPSFAGWYWTPEYPPATIPGRDSLKKLVPEIRRLTSNDIMIAPNADRGMSATLLNDVDVDIIAYQDTVGLGVEPDKFGRFAQADRLESLQRLPTLYQRLKIAHDGWQAPHQEIRNMWNYYNRSRGRTAIWNDLEIWEFDSHGRLYPTELSRIVAQLDLTAPYVDKQIIYQFPGLMCHPDHPCHIGGERAATLYEDYAVYRQARLKGIRTEK